MKKVLVVEDESAIREFEVINLKRSGYDVLEAVSGEEAIKVYSNNKDNIAVILLDVMMPGIDGFTVCKEIRKLNNIVGIIMLTAKAQEMDKVGGLMLGADDYITKPFSPSELVARVDAVYRRVELSTINTHEIIEELKSGNIVLNLRSRKLIKDNKEIELTQVEFQIMEYFFSKPGVPLSRADILNYVWGENFFGDEKVVDVNIRRIRMKIEDDPANPDHLHTVWGLGYRWEG